MGIVGICLIILGIITGVLLFLKLAFGISPIEVLGEVVEGLADCDFDLD